MGFSFESLGKLSKKGTFLFFLILGYFIYFFALFSPFVLDDETQLVNNPFVHSLANFPYFFLGSTFSIGGSGHLTGIYYKPLLSTFFALIYTIFGPNPFPFHFFQITLFIVSIFLLFLFLRTFFSQQISFFLALLLLVHPINQETVTYIADLQDILFFIFGIASLLLVRRGIKNIKEMLLVCILLFLSILSKETGILFFIVALLLQFIYFHKKRSTILFTLSVIGTGLVYSFMRVFVGHLHTVSVSTPLVPIMDASFMQRLSNMPAIFFFYFSTFILPINLSSCQYWLITKLDFSQFYFPLIVLLSFFALLIGYGIHLFKKHKKYFPPLFFFFCWFAIGAAFHAQLIPLDMTVAYRWFYFTFVGLLGMLGVAATQIISQKQQLKEVLVKITLLILFILGIVTIIRNTQWTNAINLYSHDLQTSIYPNACLESNLGVEYLRTNQPDLAKQHLEKAIQLQPLSGRFWANYGTSLDLTSNTKKAEEAYKRSIILSQEEIGYENLGGDYLYNDKNPSASAQILEKGIRYYQENQRLYILLAIAKYQLGKTQEALNAAQKAYSLYPNPDAAYVLNQIQTNQPIDMH